MSIELKPREWLLALWANGTFTVESEDAPCWQGIAPPAMIRAVAALPMEATIKELRASLAAAEDKNATLIRDLELACRDLAAVKLSRDTAEAKLADAEKHADELAEALCAINDTMWSDDEGDLAWADFQDLCDAAEPLLAAHAARRAGKEETK